MRIFAASLHGDEETQTALGNYLEFSINRHPDRFRHYRVRLGLGGQAFFELDRAGCAPRRFGRLAANTLLDASAPAYFPLLPGTLSYLRVDLRPVPVFLEFRKEDAAAHGAGFSPLLN